MQVSPSHTQRQLVSGKVGWGWRQATYPISTNFAFTGLLIWLFALMRLQPIGKIFLVIAALLTFIGLAIGVFSAKSLVQVCRQNSDYQFLRSQLIAIITYWLALIAALSIASGNEDKTLISNIVLTIWWILPAAILTGIASALTWHSKQAKAAAKKQLVEPINADILSIVSYSDQTVLISPSALAQQPRQFNSLVLIVLGFFFWTMLDFSLNLRAIATISLTVAGLTGFFTWQAQLRSSEKILHLKFSGLWGIAANYVISLQPFSSLALIKLQEAGGELSWMQLSGNNRDITLPLAMTTQAVATKEGVTNDQLSETIREQFQLANQESERDSLGLANVLLPQGAGILAGGIFITLGGFLLFLFPLPTQRGVESIIAWLGVCLVSPAIARFFLRLVAPNCLQSDRSSHIKSFLQAWEVGTVLLLLSIFLSGLGKASALIVPNQALPIFTLICGWLSISTGGCILAFVRRTPLWTANY